MLSRLVVVTKFRRAFLCSSHSRQLSSRPRRTEEENHITTQLMEASVGITEFISDSPGFR